MLIHILDNIIDFLFPKSAIVKEIETLTSYEFAEKVKASPRIPDCHVLFAYRDPLVHEALWELKYHGNKKMAKLFSPLLYEAIVSELSDESMFSTSEKAIVTTIPASKQRMENKHFDQNLIIIQAIEKEDTGKQFQIEPNILIRSKETHQQSHTHNKHERLENMEHAFKVRDSSIVKDKVIIVIDDITTTGATLSDARRALTEAGARKVYLVAIAH